MATFRFLDDDPDAARFSEAVLPWVNEAGKPYFPWFFGDAERAQSALAGWLHRPSSEVFLGRATVLLDEGEPVGGFICLGGQELERCRLADMLDILHATSRGSWTALRARIAASEELFPPVAFDEFYLSKMGIVPDYRGRGLGRELVSEYLARGRGQGFKRFRLDVWSGNAAAIGLYSSFGFEVKQESRSEPADMTYVAMTLAEDGASAGLERDKTNPKG